METSPHDSEPGRASELLAGRTVARILRSGTHVMIEFEDGVRFFVHINSSGELELSVTGTDDE